MSGLLQCNSVQGLVRQSLLQMEDPYDSNRLVAIVRSKAVQIGIDPKKVLRRTVCQGRYMVLKRCGGLTRAAILSQYGQLETSSNGSMTVHDDHTALDVIGTLKKAVDFIKECGSIERAKEILSTLEEIRE